MNVARRAMLATAGVLTAAIAACGSSGSSGPSPAYQNGYKAGNEQANAPAGPETDPQQYCEAFSTSQGGGNQKDQQDWERGCLDGFAKGKK
jgi:hypothetical protein